jgi:hypothetical protein
MSPDQLDNLVAPIALYPDPLLSQVLAASTYPLEIVAAQQWLTQRNNVQGAQRMDAAREQNWDPSVQALVAFPDALGLLANDVQWTTDLGNAFLAQQADVMAAVQRMRARARANGRLNTTPQQVVTMDNQEGQNAIEIQPADPQVVYVPVYSPTYVWGQPAWGGYYDPWYATGFGFGPGIYMSSYFPGWGGWGGWGWGCGWYGRGLFLNTGFFNRYGFRGGSFGGFGGRVGWNHNPGHRMGVPYSNRALASRYNSNRFSSGQSAGGRANAGQWQRFGNSNRGSVGSYRQASPNYGARGGSQGYRSTPSYNQSNGQRYSAPRQNYSTPRQNYSAPRQNYSAPRQSYSAPRQNYSAPRQNYSAPRQNYSAPRSSGGSSGFSRGPSGGNSRPSGGQSNSSGAHAGGGGGHRR